MRTTRAVILGTALAWTVAVAAAPPALASPRLEGGGYLHLSPSITAPSDGAVVEAGEVTISGQAEPNVEVAVYETGAASASGEVVKADPNGEWSAELDLGPGTRSFSAFESVTDVASKSVTVRVEAAPSPAELVSPLTPSGEVLSSVETAVPRRVAARLRDRLLRVGAGRRFAATLSCPAGPSRCTGTFELSTRRSARAPLVRVRFAISGGHQQPLHLRLPARALRWIARTRSLPLDAVIFADGTRGTAAAASTPVILRTG